MTDNEIIKALEYCKVALMYDEEQSLYGLALDLINRQKAEIEDKERVIQFYAGVVENKNAEIERLKDGLIDHEYAVCVGVKNGLIYTHTLEDYDNLIGDISADAIKEFAERLKEHSYRMPLSFPIIYAIHTSWIDYLVKEMLSERGAK